MTSHRHAASRSVQSRATTPWQPSDGRGTHARLPAGASPGTRRAKHHAGRGDGQGAGLGTLPRPALVGWWLLEAFAGALLVVGAAAAYSSLTRVLILAVAGVGVLVHVASVVRERLLLHRMTDDELAELLARTCAAEERYRDVYEPRHSH